MLCPTCRAGDTKVVDSRLADEGVAVRRRRRCLSCDDRFTTFERVEEVPLVVVKSDGSRELFDAEKIVGGIRAAATGRDVGDEVVARLVIDVEDSVRLAGGGEVASSRIGVVVLEHLRSVDEVTYLRFASVYKDFDAAADFVNELELLDKGSSGGDPADPTERTDQTDQTVRRRR